ncbi:MAG: rRNA maturation RNase YbeY [Lentisphaeria bacterium]|nr:rRNA maturation RNase YbeY [Lentisphaeria bacterium]
MTDVDALADVPSKAELHVIIVGEAAITRMNKCFLGHDGPTDVIAFGLGGDEPNPAGGAYVVGEVYVCLDVAVQCAPAHCQSVGAELLLYCMHGMLHLTGMDDHTPDGRNTMRCAEARITKAIRGLIDVDNLF